MLDMNPSWIQATAEVVLAVVTTYTLIVLRRYAADTKKIAENSTKQIENAQMPFVALVMNTDPSRHGNWAIRNQGTGTAVNIYYTRYLSSEQAPIMQWMTPLAPAEAYTLPRENEQLKDFTVEYESLDGIKYRTTAKQENGDVRTKFCRL